MSKEKYKIRTFGSPVNLFWMINPGVAIYEFLGYRRPKVLYYSTKDRTLPKLIPCPHCETLHSEYKWTPQNGTAFKNWYGLYCDECEGIIPCVTNVWSFMLKGISYPFRRSSVEIRKQKWLTIQKERFSKLLFNQSAHHKWSYMILTGVEWGFVIWVFVMFVIPPFLNESTPWDMLLETYIFAFLAGFVFGNKWKS